jgi:acyl carrier protein
MNDSLTDIVRAAVARHLDVEPAAVRAWHRFERDLGLSPVDVILIGLDLEEIEDIELPIDRFYDLRTVAELTALVRAVARNDASKSDDQSDVRLGAGHASAKLASRHY